jgi:hypothetical protein
VITVVELEAFLRRRLDAAFKANLIDGPMKPAARDEQRFSFLAYDGNKYFSDGVRDLILDITVQAPPDQISTVVLPGGDVQTCPPVCKALISASARGEIKVQSRRATSDLGTRGPLGGDLGIFLPLPQPPPPPPPVESVVQVEQLMKTRGATLPGGVNISVR